MSASDWRLVHRPPSRVIHVSPSGDDTNDGGEGSPLKTIQAALDRTRPGDLVAVHAGLYQEAAHFPSRRGGTRRAPIVLESVDGQGAAQLRPPEDNAIRGYGVYNIVVRGFDILGGKNAIQFSQSGDDFSATCANLSIESNVIRNPKQDGIKISQADNVIVSGNAIKDCGQQCIDFVNVYGGRIENNDVSGAQTAGAIMVKGGSRDIDIERNWVHDLRGHTVAGIEIGGWMSAGPYVRPGAPEAEAFNVNARENCVENVEGYALAFMGARSSRAEGNVLSSIQSSARRTAPAVIAIERGSPRTRPVDSRNLTIRHNILRGEKRDVQIDTRYHDVARDQILIMDNIVYEHEEGDEPLVCEMRFPHLRALTRERALLLNDRTSRIRMTNQSHKANRKYN